MRRRRLSIGVGLGLTHALSADITMAADGPTARARALFDEAGELERRRQWSAAQERLRAALRLRETPHLHYALGWALENDDKLLEAKAEYETAARLARDRPGADEGLDSPLDASLSSSRRARSSRSASSAWGRPTVSRSTAVR